MDSLKEVLVEIEMRKLELQLQQIGIQCDIKEHEATVLTEDVVDRTWKTNKSEFVCYHEERCREEHRVVIKYTTEFILQCEKEKPMLSDKYGKNKARFEELITEKKQLQEELATLPQVNSANAEIIDELQNSVNLLNKRNSAIQLKLNKQKEDYENQIQVFTSTPTEPLQSDTESESSIEAVI